MGAFEVDDDTLEEEEPEREEAPNLDKEAYTTARFKPILIPPNTPLAALLAGSIQIPVGHSASSRYVLEEYYV